MTLDVRLPVTAVEFPPESALPHVTTEPLLFNAAKADPVEYTAVTFEVRLPVTAVEFPPLESKPQVTTEPLVFSAAKAP